MQVGGNYNSNYNSYSGSDYNYSTHNHHITEHLHEEQVFPKRTDAQADVVGVTLEIQGKALEKTQSVVVEENKEHFPGQVKGLLRAVSGIIPMIRQGFNVLITERFESVRERLKVGIHTALKRFGKDSEPFGALTDPGTGSLFGSRTGNGTGKGSSKSGNSHIKEENIESTSGINEHLMDSYSKSGKYCKINENLTYSRGRAPYKVSERNTQRKLEDSF